MLALHDILSDNIAARRHSPDLRRVAQHTDVGTAPHAAQGDIELPMREGSPAQVDNSAIERLALRLVEGHSVRQTQRELPALHRHAGLAPLPVEQDAGHDERVLLRVRSVQALPMGRIHHLQAHRQW